MPSLKLLLLRRELFVFFCFLLSLTRYHKADYSPSQVHPGSVVHHRVVVALHFLGRHLTLTVTTVVVFLFFSHASGSRPHP